jgi:hypothetical protein
MQFIAPVLPAVAIIGMIGIGSVAVPTTQQPHTDMFHTVSRVDTTVSRGCIDGHHTIACMVKSIAR